MRIAAIVPVLVLAFSTMTAMAADTALITKPSGNGGKETMDRLEAVVKEKGMTVFARIDHQQNAVGAGLEMPAAEVLIFGKPEAGTKIMNNDLRSGLDLPMRVLVHEGEDGQAWITYRNPLALREAFDLGECPTLGKLEGAMAAITDAAAK